jgi:hypothetical protein
MMQGVVWKGHLHGSSYQSCDYFAMASYVWQMPKGGTPQSVSAPEYAPFGAAISL